MVRHGKQSSPSSIVGSPPAKQLKLGKNTDLPSADEIITEKDLPLLANVDDVRVQHYLMKLSTDFDKKVVTGSVILFLEWRNPSADRLVLDQCFLRVKSVNGLKTESDYKAVAILDEYGDGSGQRKNLYRSSGHAEYWFSLKESIQQLNFTQDKWSLIVSGWGDEIYRPSVVRIEYETLESSPSIHWRPCDGFSYSDASSKCCYTSAAAVNNRGLFPCQEPPVAMSTWELLLECEKDYIPLVTSDETGIAISENERTHRYYFFSSVPLPTSAFAMIIGKFWFKSELVTLLGRKNVNKTDTPTANDNACLGHSRFPCRFGNYVSQQEDTIPVRLFSLDRDCVPRALPNFTNFVYSCLKTGFENLGPHPFSRLDIVIVPKCYPHEGLSSPSMIFISPSNFYGQQPLYLSRLPHEISHSWFGLLIGCLDCTEEWLSEGFATFAEDFLFPVNSSSQSPEAHARDHALKILLRFTSLQTELQNTQSDSDLHVISTENKKSNSAENGLAPLKQFMRVHYYKGYLLLCHLANLVGLSEFKDFLKQYIWKYHGQLVTSDIFLACFQLFFSSTLVGTDFDLANVKRIWLQASALPEPYKSLDLLNGVNITEQTVPATFSAAIAPLKAIKEIFNDLVQERNTPSLVRIENLSSNQLLVLFELMLNPDIDSAKKKVLERKYYQYFVTNKVFEDIEKSHNSDVCHRWCELIIQFKDKSRLPVVANFLRNNICMGVYLYGELMITEKYAFQKVARHTYRELQHVYDLATKKILKEMIF